MSGVSTLKVVKHKLTIAGKVVHTLNGGKQGPPGPFVPTGQTKQVLFVNAAGTGADADSGFTYDKTTGVLTIGGKTVTASAPVLQATQTWNNAGVTFTGALINITDTQSAAASKLVDWQVGGVSQFSIDKAGSALFGASAGVPFGIGLDQTKFSRGIYAQSGANSVYLKAASTLVFGYQHGAGMVLSNNLPLGWSPLGSDASASPDLTLFRGGAGILEQRNGANAQTQRWYETFIDASNYSRAFVRTSGTAYEFGGEAAGTGTARNTFLIAPTGKEVFFQIATTPYWKINAAGLTPHAVDNGYDLGTSGTRVRAGYFGTSVAVGSLVPAFSFHALGGGARLQVLANPVISTVTQSGTPGGTSYTYFVVAKDLWGNKTAVSAAFTTNTGAATLNTTNFNTITWAAVPGAVNYDVLKGDTGHSIALGITATTFDDKIAGVGSVYTAPTRNATADLTVDGIGTIDGVPFRGVSWNQPNSFCIGVSASVTGTAVTVIGTSATASFGSTALGENSAAGADALALGRTARAGLLGGTGSIAIGPSAVASGVNASIALGYGALADTNKTLAIGSPLDPNLAIADVFIGSSRTSTNPQSVTIHASSGSGTDIAGANITIAGGNPTGAGAGGSIFFSTALAGTTGTTLRSLTNRWQIDQNGNLLAAAGGGVFQPRTYTVSQLPTASTVSGARATVSDSTVAASGNFAATLTGGGTNTAPVWSDGTSWRIG
jgi:hypothetical protein